MVVLDYHSLILKGLQHYKIPMTHILITNDDGITAPGLRALVKEIRKIGQITVLAPDRNWSASGHVKTMHRPLRVKEVQMFGDIPAFTTDGAPSDCVSLAQLGFIPQQIDLVLSGINPNANIGHDVTYSGTVTAAMEAVIRGIPGIAVSVDSPDNHLGDLDYSTPAKIAGLIAKQFLANGFPDKTVINVNVPYLPYKSVAGILITRQGLRVYKDSLIQRKDPRNQPYFWIGGEAPTGIIEEGTDYGAVKAGFVSITPIKLDLTAYNQIENLQEMDWNLDTPEE